MIKAVVLEDAIRRETLADSGYRGRIADEVVSHLAGLVGANMKVTLEISADVQNGVPEKVVRTVTENCRTLKFGSHGFEES
ncbi:MAG: hypothetical protein WCC87_19225 [Candidatus Korobacteraceae bacterium]